VRLTWRLKLKTSNLARRRAAVNSNKKNAKLVQKGSCVGHVTHFWNFGTPLISCEPLKLATSNLARRRTAVSSNEKNAKFGQKGSCGGHVTQFWNYVTALISRQRLKLETSNLAWWRTAVNSNRKTQNYVKRGHVGVTWPTFGILGPVNISRTVEASNFKFCKETNGCEF